MSGAAGDFGTLEAPDDLQVLMEKADVFAHANMLLAMNRPSRHFDNYGYAAGSTGTKAGVDTQLII